MARVYIRNGRTVQAVPVTPLNSADIEEFVGGDIGGPADALVVAGPVGPIPVRLGEWIVKEASGRFFAISDEGFHILYGPVD